MNTNLYSFHSHHFHPASPTLLAYFRQQLEHMSLSSWQQNSAILWASEFTHHFPERALETITKQEFAAFLQDVVDQYRLGRHGYSEIIQSIQYFYRATGTQLPDWLDQLIEGIRARSRRRPPYLSRTSIRSVLPRSEYRYQIPVALLYGAGLKVYECCNLRVQDVLIDSCCLRVRNRQNEITHQTVMPKVLVKSLINLMNQRHNLHLKDTALQFAGAPFFSHHSKTGSVYSHCWRDQFFFCAGQLSPIRNGGMARYGINPKVLVRVIDQTAARMDMETTLNADSLRNSYAHHLAQNGVASQLILYTMGLHPDTNGTSHTALETVQSPLDELWPHYQVPWPV